MFYKLMPDVKTAFTLVWATFDIPCKRYSIVSAVIKEIDKMMISAYIVLVRTLDFTHCQLSQNNSLIDDPLE